MGKVVGAVSLFSQLIEMTCGLSLNGGKRGIRTLEPREGLPVFKTGVFNRSTSFPPSVLLKNTRVFKGLAVCCKEL